jgi:hypothetical protein
MWLTTAPRRITIDQAAGLREWVERCEGLHRKKVPTVPIVVVTGGIPAERIRLCTLNLAMTAAADGIPTMVCHSEQSGGVTSGSGEPPTSLVEPILGEAAEPARDQPRAKAIHNQAAGLHTRQLSGSIREEKASGGSHPKHPTRPAVLHVLPRLFQAVFPSRLTVPADWHVIGRGTWTFVEALPDNEEWFRYWQPRATTLLLLGSSDRRSRIDTYLLLKRLHTYCHSIFLAVEHEDKRQAKQVYHHIAGAAREFLGLSTRYAGCLPPPRFCWQPGSAEDVLLYRRILHCLTNGASAQVCGLRSIRKPCQTETV